MEKSKNRWDDVIVQSLMLPVRLLIYIIGFSFALELLKENLNLEILSAVSSIKDVLIVFVMMSFMLRLIRNYEEDVKFTDLVKKTVTIQVFK